MSHDPSLRLCYHLRQKQEFNPCLIFFTVLLAVQVCRAILSVNLSTLITVLGN
jgi:hypothetical protein